jgi:SOS-response transcriptional repressor LexA
MSRIKMKKTSRPDYRLETVELFKKINLTDQEVATATHTFYTTIGRWRRGEVSPSKKHFQQLKRLANGEMMLREPSVPYLVHPSPPTADSINLPILSSIPSGSAHESVEEKVGQIFVPPILLGGNWKDCYLLRVEGTIMEPEAKNGDWVIVKQNKTPKSGDWIAVKTNGEYTIKKYVQNLKSEGVVIWIMKKP